MTPLHPRSRVRPAFHAAATGIGSSRPRGSGESDTWASVAAADTALAGLAGERIRFPMSAYAHRDLLPVDRALCPGPAASHVAGRASDGIPRWIASATNASMIIGPKAAPLFKLTGLEENNAATVVRY